MKNYDHITGIYLVMNIVKPAQCIEISSHNYYLNTYPVNRLECGEKLSTLHYSMLSLSHGNWTKIRTWNMKGVDALEKLKTLKMWLSRLYLERYPWMMTVLAEPCSPINRTALLCFAIVSMRKSVLTLSTFGTRILRYSGIESLGYAYSGTCTKWVHRNEMKFWKLQILY